MDADEVREGIADSLSGQHATEWKLLATVSGVLAARTVARLLEAGWAATHGGNPPRNPASKTTSWGEAVVWSGLAGAVMGITRMVATRVAAGAWERRTGSLPPGLEDVGA